MTIEVFLFLIAGGFALAGVVIFFLLRQIGEIRNRLTQDEQKNHLLSEHLAGIADLERYNTELLKTMETRQARATDAPIQAGYIADLLDIGDASSTPDAITRAVSQLMQADICLFISAPDNSNQARIESGYDLRSKENLEASKTAWYLIPMLANALQGGRPLRLASNDNALVNFKGLSDLLGLVKPGALLLVPLLASDGKALGGILLLSPYSNRGWTASDQMFLQAIARHLLLLIKRGQRMARLEARIPLLETQLNALTRKTTQFQLIWRAGPRSGETFPLEGDQLIVGRHAVNEIAIDIADISNQHARLDLVDGNYVLEDLNSTNGTFVNGQRLHGPHALVDRDIVSLGEHIVLEYNVINKNPDLTTLSSFRDARVDALPGPVGHEAPASHFARAIQAELDRTLDEVARLQNQLAEANRRLFEAEKGNSLVRSNGPIESELRSTLEEVARLQNQLAEVSQGIGASENGDSSVKLEQVASISQELRQPVSSVTGYVDLLLGESVGILGALQRKFMERIKGSTERIGGLIDDLIQVTTPAEMKPEAVDLTLIIDHAMTYTGGERLEKYISMHLDLPKNMPPIQADREALQQIMIHLLRNAAAASPAEGIVRLRVQMKTEAGRENVLIQVSDTGGGIPPEALPSVFTRMYRADNTSIKGVGDTGVGLSIAKTLTEAQHGRIWVESEEGIGSTFNVLLPMAKPAEVVDPNPIIDHAVSPVNLQEIPWLQDSSKAAQRLKHLVLESSAQAALITRKNDLWAYAGQLSLDGAKELGVTVTRHWDGQKGRDLLRFIRLEGTQAEHMLYATRLANEVVLALVFDAETPFSTIRSQAGQLVNKLFLPIA